MANKRSFKRPRNRYGRFVSTAFRVGRSLYNSYTSTRQRPGKNSGGGVTAQYDRSLQYRYKRMPRAKRGRIRRFARSVNRVIDRALATQTILRNSSLSGSWTDGVQQVFAVTVYGWSGVNDSLNAGADDMDAISLSVFASQPSKKIRFMNCHVDATYQNTGSTNSEVDVYEYYWKAAETQQNLVSSWDDAASETPTIAGTALTRNTRGATPFEFPMLCRQMKILKKTKYLVPVGQAFTYQMRDRKNRVLTNDDVVDYQSFAKRGWTKGFFFVCKSTVGDTEGDGACKIGVSRTYRFSTIESSLYGDGVIA